MVIITPWSCRRQLTGWFQEGCIWVPPGICRTQRPAFTSPLGFKILVQSSTGGKRETFYYFWKTFGKEYLRNILKAWCHHYWKSTHSTYYQKTDAGAKEAGLLFPVPQSLLYRMLCREKKQLPQQRKKKQLGKETYKRSSHLKAGPFKMWGRSPAAERRQPLPAARSRRWPVSAAWLPVPACSCALTADPGREAEWGLNPLSDLCMPRQFSFSNLHKGTTWASSGLPSGEVWSTPAPQPPPLKYSE